MSTRRHLPTAGLIASTAVVALGAGGLRRRHRSRVDRRRRLGRARRPRSSSSRPSTPRTTPRRSGTSSPRPTRPRPATPSTSRSSAGTTSTSRARTMIQNNNPPDILNLNAYASYAKDDLLYSSDEVLSDCGEVRPARRLREVAAPTTARCTACPTCRSARALFYNKTLFKQGRHRRAAEDVGRVRGRRQEDHRPRQRRHRLRPAARPGGGPGASSRSGCSTTAATGRPTASGRINSPAERRDADLPQEPAPTRR